MKSLVLVVIACNQTAIVHAVPVTDPFKTADTYLTELQTKRGGPSVPGPNEAIFRVASSSNTAPIARLQTLLATCRGASMTAMLETAGVKVAKQFECARNPSAKAVTVTLTVDRLGRSVKTIEVAFGGKVSWAGPPPSGPAWKRFDQALYDRYKGKSETLLRGLAAGSEGAMATVPERITLYGGNPERQAITSTRLRAIVRNCRVISTVAAAVPDARDNATREGVKTRLKCDPASSAPEDLVIYASFANGAIDALLIAPIYDYVPVA